MKHAIVVGDCLEALANLEDNSIDLAVTDPPYGLSQHTAEETIACISSWLAGEPYDPKGRGFMGATWDAWVPGPEVWREVFRVLKPGGHVAAFSAPRTYDLMTLALRLASFEIRDCLMWIFGSGFPKSQNAAPAIDKYLGTMDARGAAFNTAGYGSQRSMEGKAGAHGKHGGISPEAQAWAAYGTALKPAYEPITLARKPLGQPLAPNLLEHGTGALNIDGCRVPTRESTIRPNGPIGYQGGGSGGTGGSEAGRWPANLILSDEGSEDWRRYFYSPKASRAEREEGLYHLIPKVVDPSRAMGSDGRKSPRAGAGRSGKPRANPHPTVKPLSLMRWLVKLLAPPGAVVLDPFAGSGSTGVACVHEGFGFIGCELSPHFAAVARGRIAHALGEPPPLPPPPPRRPLPPPPRRPLPPPPPGPV